MAVVRFPTERTPAEKATLILCKINEALRKSRIEIALARLEYAAFHANTRDRRPVGFKRDLIRPAP